MLKYQLVISVLLLTLVSCGQNGSSGLEYYQELYNNLLLTKEISKDIDVHANKILLVKGGSCSSCGGGDVTKMLNRFKPDLFIYIGDSGDLNFFSIPQKIKCHIVSVAFANSNGFLTAEELLISIRNRKFNSYQLID